MANYPTTEERVQQLEQQIQTILKRLERLDKWIHELKKEIEPAVTAQRIRDEWDGLGK